MKMECKPKLVFTSGIKVFRSFFSLYSTSTSCDPKFENRNVQNGPEKAATLMQSTNTEENLTALCASHMQNVILNSDCDKGSGIQQPTTKVTTETNVTNTESDESASIPCIVSNVDEDEPSLVTENVLSDDSEIEHISSRKKKKNKLSHKVSASSVLELKYPWVLIKEKEFTGKKEPVLFCKLCMKHNSANKYKNSWVNEGYRTLRKDKVKLHAISQQHQESVRCEIEEENRNLKEIKCVKSDLVCAEAMFQIIFYIAKNDLPLENFSSLVDLSIQCGSKDLLPIRQSSTASYRHITSVHELLDFVSTSIDDIMLPEIRNSLTYSLIVDEVTDSSSIKNLGIIIKFVSCVGEAKIKFLADREMQRSTGEMIKDTILQVLREKNMDPLNCTNVTSDGASSFLGKSNGAGKLLSDIMGNIIVMHCNDHRLALAARDTFNAIRAMDLISEGLDALYKFYKYSSVSAASLKEIQDICHSAHWRVQKAKHHRWLSYDKAVLTVLKGHDILIQDLENSIVSEEQPKQRLGEAQGILSWLTSEKVIRTLALLGDVLPHLSELSLVYQRRNADLGSVEPTLIQTYSVINKLKSRKGFWSKKVEKNKFLIKEADCSEDTFNNNIKAPFLNKLTENLEERFQDSEVISNLSTLALPIYDSDLMKSIPMLYREVHIEALSEFFNLENDEDKAGVVEEWSSFISWLKTVDIPKAHEKDSSLPFLAKLFLDKSSEKSSSLSIKYPKLSFLYSVAISLALSSAEVERLFSHLKLVKNLRRSSLGNKRLNQLLSIKLNVEEEDWPQIRKAAAENRLKFKNRKLKHFFY